MLYPPSSPPPVAVQHEVAPEPCLHHGSGCPVATSRTIVHDFSREALLQDAMAASGQGGYAGCPGLGSCGGCWRQRGPRHGPLIMGEIVEPEPPLSIAPPEDEFLVVPPLSTLPPLPHHGLELSGPVARIGPKVYIPSPTPSLPRDMLSEQR